VGGCLESRERGKNRHRVRRIVHCPELILAQSVGKSGGGELTVGRVDERLCLPRSFLYETAKGTAGRSSRGKVDPLTTGHGWSVGVTCQGKTEKSC